MRWSRRFLGRALLTAALSAGAALGLVSSAAASTSQPVRIDNKNVADPQAQCGVLQGLTLTFSARGGVFGNGVSGTHCVLRLIITHTPKTFPHSIVNTIHRTEVYTPNDGSGTFTLGIQQVGRLVPRPPSDCPTVPGVTFPGDQCNTIAYKGSATVKGGTGRYTGLRGTLDFTSSERFDLNPSVFETVYATEHMVGSLHIN